MNKSKFLKRSLATLLAILMVVAMVPMSAFAAVVIAEDVPTAREVDDPGYEIAINGKAFTWNGSGYETTYAFVNDNSGVSPTVQLSMTNKNTKDTTFILTDTGDTLTTHNLGVQLSSAKKKEMTDAYGSGTYEFTLETRKELGTEQKIDTYPLIIKATVQQRDNDTRVLAVRSSQMPQMTDYDIEYYENGGGKIIIYMTLSTNLATAASANGIDLFDGATNTEGIDDIGKVFTVSPTVKEMTLNNQNLTVTAENGHTDTYDIVLKHESAFDSFALEDADGNVYEGKVDNENNPKRIIVDLPYDKFYVDSGYKASGPDPVYGVSGTASNTDIIGKLEKLKASWTTSRDKAVVKYGTSYAAGATATSGKQKLAFVHYTSSYTDDPNNSYGLNTKNGNDDWNYLIFTSKYGTTGEDGTNTTAGGLFVDTKSRAIDSTALGAYADHSGEIEIIVRVPLYNPSTELEGIQIKGIDNFGSDGKNEGSGKQTNIWSTGNSEQWSQYIAINGDNINVIVPKDVLKLGPNQEKENEKNNKRAFVRLWGAYGAKVLLPWDTVLEANKTDKIDANGFETNPAVGNPDSVHLPAYDDILAGNGKTGAEAQSDSSILVTETNNNRTTVKSVIVRVTAQDGNSYKDYTLRVNEQGVNDHATNLQSVVLKDGDGEVVATAQPSTDGNYTLQVPYAVGSTDDGNIAAYTVEAVAQNGGRISYKAGAKPVDPDLGTASAFKAFVKSVPVSSLTGGTPVAEQLTEADRRIQTAVGHEFTLRVWDNTGITTKGVFTDHTIKFVMPNPAKDQRISNATVMADKLAPVDGDGVEFNTVVNNQDHTITVTLPYAYKYLDEICFADLKLDGLGARMYITNSDIVGQSGTNLTRIVANKKGTATKIMTNTGSNDATDKWLKDNKNSISVYVMSEEGYSRLVHGWTNGKSGTDTPWDFSTKTAQNLIDQGTKDNYNYVTEYKLTAVVEAPERGNTLTSIESTNKFVQVERDTSASKITVTVPRKYATVNAYTTAAAGNTVFNLDFTTDSSKARVYMDWKNDKSGDNNTANRANDVQYRNNGIPAEGIPEFIAPSQSMAIVPTSLSDYTPTKFWVSLEDVDADGNNEPILRYTNENGQTYPTTGGVDGVVAYEAIVAAEYSKWNSAKPQEVGGTRPYTVITKIADAETDPAITGITVGGNKATLYENEETGEAIWTVSLPYGSRPAQPITIETAGKFTEVKVDGETFDPEAYYITNIYDDLILVSTPESGSVHKTYTLHVVNGDADSNTNLAEVRVDGYTATLGDNNTYTVMPADTADLTAMSLTLRAASTKAQGIQVNGAPYTEGMTVDLSEGKTVTIIVTAENGATGTYTLKVGEPSTDLPSDKFTDLDKCSASLKDEVTRAINMGITNGTSATTFTPKANVRRVDFAVMIARADLIASGQAANVDEAKAKLAASVKNNTPFTDIASLNDEQKAAIEYCYENKIINGTGNGTTFSPTDSMTREMAAKVITVWSGTTVDTNDKENHTKFTSDWNKVSNWAKPYVNSVATTGLMKGNGATTFDPQGKVTREMAAALLVRVFDQKYPTFGK